jgi:hypothetical protein
MKRLFVVVVLTPFIIATAYMVALLSGKSMLNVKWFSSLCRWADKT